MFDYHAANNYQLTTFDADHDVYSANCSNSYGNTAWWYGACWSGSFWGGGDSGGYTNNPYWTSSGGEYFSWGGIWVRDPAEITTGSYLRDSSSMVVNGTPGGTSIVDGFYGKARNFNGTSDYINTPWTGSLPNWTIEAWISDNGTRTNYRAIVQTQDPNVSGQSDHALYIYPSASNNVLAFWPYGGGTVPIMSYQWYHVAVTYNGSTVQYYVNGMPAGSATPGNVDAIKILRIGGWGTGDSEHFGGKIDEVRVSNTARTADEIAEAYRAGRDHRIGRGFASTDLSGKSKLPLLYSE